MKGNKARPDIKIMLDRERILSLDLNAMCKFEELTGESIFTRFTSFKKSAKDIREMLWLCLIHEDETLTLEQVGALVSPLNMLEVSRKLTQAIEIAMPGKKSDSRSAEAHEVPLAEKPQSG